MATGIIFIALFQFLHNSDTMRLPIQGGKIITAVEKTPAAHRGIFIRPSGDFQVRSCSDGIVKNVFQLGADWAVVILQQDTSYAYAQMDSVVIHAGEEIHKGDVIGQRKFIPNDYNSIIFFVLTGNKELDPEKFIDFQK